MLGGLKGGAHKACGRGVGFGEDYSARARTAVEAANVLPGQIIVDNALLRSSAAPTMKASRPQHVCKAKTRAELGRSITEVRCPVAFRADAVSDWPSNGFTGQPSQSRTNRTRCIMVISPRFDLPRLPTMQRKRSGIQILWSMKRDMDLIRMILLQQETGEGPPKLAEYPEEASGV